MPHLKTVDDLWTVSARKFTEELINSFVEEKTLDWCNNCRSYVHESVPAGLMDRLIDIAILSMSGRRSEDSWMVSDPRACRVVLDVLSVLLHPSMSRLDLSGIIRLNLSEDSYVHKPRSDFESLMLSHLPSMTALTALTLRTHGCDVILPLCTDAMLAVIGSSCSHLEYLDVSYNTQVTGWGLKALTPTECNMGCPELKKLFLYECSVDSKDVAYLLLLLPGLTFVGYKEMGQMLRLLARFGCPLTHPLKLTHLDNLGEKVNKTDILGCDKKLVALIQQMCPEVQFLRVRVRDQDLAHLSDLERVSCLELCYNTKTLHSVGDGLRSFLRLRGDTLTSLSIICNTLSEWHVTIIGETCSMLRQLWLRCNQLVMNDVSFNFGEYFGQLKSLNIHVGKRADVVVHVPKNLLLSLLTHCQELQTLTLLMRSDLLTDDFVAQVLHDNPFRQLEKFVLDVPFRDTWDQRALALTERSVDLMVARLPQLNTLGNLYVWSCPLASPQWKHLEAMYDLTIIRTMSGRLVGGMGQFITV